MTVLTFPTRQSAPEPKRTDSCQAPGCKTTRLSMYNPSKTHCWAHHHLDEEMWAEELRPILRLVMAA